MLLILPNQTQVKNRKQALKNSTADPTTNTLAYLQEWCNTRTCTSAHAFFGPMARFDPATDLEIFSKQRKGFQDEVLVLSCFPHNVDTPGG